MIVAKFGGTSVADAEAIGRLIEIVRSRAGCQPVVVVSALARVTDGLLALAHQCGSGDGSHRRSSTRLLDGVSSGARGWWRRPWREPVSMRIGWTSARSW